MTNVYRQCLLVIVMLWVISASSLSEKTEKSHDTAMFNVYVAHYIDPDIIDSEWNHHVAGYSLIGSALLYVVGLSVSRLSWARSSWIILLIAAAMFLAVWSDKEIWPRGSLSWMWLIHHDAEARQHKIYALLLFAIAFVEYFRQSGKLNRFWGTWTFPTLALLGALFLMMHTHDGHSGLPAGWDNVEKRTKISQMADIGAMPTGMDLTQIDAAPENHVHADRAPQQTPSMPMPPLLEGSSASMQAARSGGSEHHHHGGATAGSAHVEYQHLWFAVVGIALAVFKCIDDGHFWPGKFSTFLWPCSMFTLGVLLVLYTEVK